MTAFNIYISHSA